ncbi:Hypothetical predicted protein, partial [Pelobates cultripes]
ESDDTCISTAEPTNEFASYYTKLYELREDKSTHITEIVTFLNLIRLPQISMTDYDSLTRAFDNEKIILALSALPPHKLPGPDGLTN